MSQSIKDIVIRQAQEEGVVDLIKSNGADLRQSSSALGPTVLELLQFLMELPEEFLDAELQNVLGHGSICSLKRVMAAKWKKPSRGSNPYMLIDNAMGTHMDSAIFEGIEIVETLDFRTFRDQRPMIKLVGVMNLPDTPNDAT
jgi:hypothetical protein